MTSKELTIKEKACNNDTYEHIHQVMKNICLINAKLTQRMLEHDQTKLKHPEVEYFVEYTPKLQQVNYGSEEYKECLKGLKPALDHHYATSRHHPEHYKNGINDMTLVDLMEMFCDWAASSKRQMNGNLRTSIEKNRERFGMSDQLVRIFENTINELGE